MRNPHNTIGSIPQQVNQSQFESDNASPSFRQDSGQNYEEEPTPALITEGSLNKLILSSVKDTGNGDLIGHERKVLGALSKNGTVQIVYSDSFLRITDKSGRLTTVTYPLEQTLLYASLQEGRDTFIVTLLKKSTSEHLVEVRGLGTASTFG